MLFLFGELIIVWILLSDPLLTKLVCEIGSCMCYKAILVFFVLFFVIVV